MLPQQLLQTLPTLRLYADRKNYPLQTLPEHLLSSLRYSQHKHNAPVEEVVSTPDRVP